MKQRRRIYYSTAQRAEIWDRWRRVIRKAHGSAAQTKTPTGCCASIYLNDGAYGNLFDATRAHGLSR